MVRTNRMGSANSTDSSLEENILSLSENMITVSRVQREFEVSFAQAYRVLLRMKEKGLIESDVDKLKI